MLLIPDIHINSTYKEKIIDAIKEYISSNKDEKNIIFVWDYVYHFSYDRNALMMLYNLFLDLFHEWKTVYVLAWNHDWLWDSFVFQEAQKAFEIVNKSNNLWKIYFVTEPEFFDIEGESFFMLPSFIKMERWKDATDRKSFRGKMERWNENNLKEINEQIKILKESQNKNEQMAGKVNQILLDFIDKFLTENPNKNLTVIHHYYFHNTVFPWQKSRFSYKDIALSEEFLNLKNVRFVSWHLHQSFVFKNYLCIGSLWSTSPLEVNQVKYFCKLNSDKVDLEQININPYILIDKSLILQNEKIDEKYIENFYLEILENSQKNFENEDNIWNIKISKNKNLDLKSVNLTIRVPEIDYKQIDSIIDENLRKSLKDVKLKKESVSIQDLLQDFEVSTKNLSTGFADWKVILKAYLEKKYQDEYGKYEKVLQELKLI